MAKIMDGKLVSEYIRGKIKDEAASLKARNIVPGLAVILVGDDPASKIYVNNKKKACEQLGFYSEEHLLPADISQEDLMAIVQSLNVRSDINGILCQLPLPSHLDVAPVIEAINPLKDVDAFHPVNVGRIMTGDFKFLPCTPAGVMEMIEYYGIDVDGKSCCVIGRSDIVGKPMSMLMLHKNATVTICHSHTKNLNEICRAADIIVAAIGRPRFVTADMVKPGAVVIDVGINRLETGKICGDVDFDNVEPIASYITPVPGGVGPMTITMLMKNTLTAAKIQNLLDK